MADTPTRPDLDAIEARAAAATPGPWEQRERHGRDHTGEGWSEATIITGATRIAEMYSETCNAQEWTENSVFIAHARTDVVDLAAEVRRLRAVNDAISWELDRERHEYVPSQDYPGECDYRPHNGGEACEREAGHHRHRTARVVAEAAKEASQ